MRVYLHQYREPDTESGEAMGEGTDTSSEEYFDTDDVTPDEWEHIEYGDRMLQRRAVEFHDVTELSVPRSVEEPSDLPGADIQLVIEGGNEFVENVQVIEVMDDEVTDES